MGRFKPGEVNNPKGRPHGSGIRQKLFAELVLPHKEKIIETAINLALSGNETMLKVLLEKLLPARPIDEPIDITLPEDIGSPPSLIHLSLEALKGLQDKTLTPSNALALMTIIKEFRENSVIVDLYNQLQSFKQNLAKQKTNKGVNPDE